MMTSDLLPLENEMAKTKCQDTMWEKGVNPMLCGNLERGQGMLRLAVPLLAFFRLFIFSTLKAL